jgi:putative heme transporter
MEVQLDAPSASLSRGAGSAAVAPTRAFARRAPSRRRASWKLWALLVVGVLLATELVLVAPDVGRAVSAVGRSDWRWLAVAIAAELVSMAAFARVQRRMLLAGGASVSLRRMMVLTYVSNAVNATMPGGTAVSSGYVFRRLRAWGATVPAAAFTILASGALSVLSFALLAVLGVAIAGHGGLESIVFGAIVVLAALVVLATRRYRKPDLLARVATRVVVAVHRLVRRRPSETGLARVQRLAGELAAIRPRGRDWFTGLSFAGLNWLADLACLLACCQAVGSRGSSSALVLVAYLAGMGTSSLSPLPGGIGMVDAAMIFALTQGGIGPVPATAAVLLYRLISFAMVVTLGWLMWGAGRVGEHYRRASEVVSLRPSPALAGESAESAIEPAAA